MNKESISKALIILFTMGALTACSSDSDNGDDELPLGSIEMTIDGEEWSAEQAFGGFFEEADTTITLLFAGDESSGDRKMFIYAINIGGEVDREYQHLDMSAVPYDSFNGMDGFFAVYETESSSYISESGSVNLTSAGANKEVKGDFSLTFTNESPDTQSLRSPFTVSTDHFSEGTDSSNPINSGKTVHSFNIQATINVQDGRFRVFGGEVTRDMIDF